MSIMFLQKKYIEAYFVKLNQHFNVNSKYTSSILYKKNHGPF